jgi:hypothetical protein
MYLQMSAQSKFIMFSIDSISSIEIRFLEVTNIVWQRLWAEVDGDTIGRRGMEEM